MRSAIAIITILLSSNVMSADYDGALNFLDASTNVSCAAGANQPLCDNPSSLCSERQEDTFEKEKYAIKKMVAPSDAPDPFEKAYNDMINAQPGEEGNELILAKLIVQMENLTLKKFDKTNKDLKILIDQIKISLAKQAAKDFSSEMAKTIEKKLSKIKFINANSLPANPNYVWNFVRFCGFDGMVKNAFYMFEENSLTLCPGYLLNSLLRGQGQLDNLSMVIGHELGHSFHTKEFTGGDSNKSPEHFEKFLSCMDQNFTSDKSFKFGSNRESIDQLEKRGLPGLKAEIERVSKTDPVDLNYLSDLKRSLAGGDFQLESYKYDLNLPIQNLSVKTELIADYESAATVRDLLLLLPQADRPTRLKQMVGVFCNNFTPNEKKVMAIKWGDINPASHPPDTFRLENYFRNPEIRSLLGCSPLKASEKPWCSTEGVVRN